MNSLFRLDAVHGIGKMSGMTKKPQILVPSWGAGAWQHLLASPDLHWKPGHSAMAGALCWEEAVESMPNGLPPEISEIVGKETRLILAIPEHKVPIPGGRAPSQSDVFALLAMEDGTCTLTVETVRDESFGPLIHQWQEKTANGGEDRLTALCNELDVEYPPPADLRYQLFHRTVSAIYEADRFNAGTAAMIVHSFFPGNEDGFGDFAAFCGLLGFTDVERSKPMRKPLPSGRDLLLGWAQGDPGYLQQTAP